MDNKNNETIYNLNIKRTPHEDRPYEKLEMLGADALTDSELLAIIIKSGTKEKNCVELAKILMAQNKSGLAGFNYIDSLSLDELKSFKGIGRVKAIQLKAVMEIAKRVSKMPSTRIKKITCPNDIYNLLGKELGEKQVEELRVVILNTKNVVKSVVTIAKGSQSKAVISVKELLNEPLKQMAASIVIVHNHPSGDSKPSRQDIEFTKKICSAAKIFEIEVLDHIVICNNEYTSIKELNSSIFNEGRRII